MFALPSETRRPVDERRRGGSDYDDEDDDDGDFCELFRKKTIGVS